MSTDFVSDKPIDFSKIKSFDFMDVKIEEVHEDGSVLLTDGTNYLWAYPVAKFEKLELRAKKAVIGNGCLYGEVVFTRYSGNIPDKIIRAIEAFFKVTLVSEYQDEFHEIVSGSGIMGEYPLDI